jgi:hypothetical protein
MVPCNLVCINISEKHTASIFRAEDKCKKILQGVYTYLTDYAVL